MPGQVIVIKFGGSVLADEASLPRVVHEVYSRVRQGWKVVAVVSALSGHTDRLLAQAGRYGQSPDPASVAALAGHRECASAALLGLALDRAGVAVEVLDAAAIGLRTAGPTLDSEPVSVDEGALRRAFDRAPVVVVPGFIGRDAEGRVTLLGRGGSDLTAIFLAARLGARCRLVKDVDGLYDRDPASAKGVRARRFATLTWSDAARLGGKVIQAKSAAIAKEHAVAFEVGGLLRPDGTLVGASVSAVEERVVAPPSPLRVVVLGAGTVGRGVLDLLSAQPDRFTVLRVAVRDVAKAAASGVDPRLLTREPLAAAGVDADVVVEALGGLDPAAGCIRRALLRGCDVVTANKAVVAEHGAEFESLAREHGGRVLHSAAVGGATPVLELVSRLAREPGVASIEAVVNGTTNFVLGRVAEGASFDDAVREAQRAGFAEADPSRDLDGRDAEDKLRLLARAAFGDLARTLVVRREGISPGNAASGSGVVKHVAEVRRGPDGIDASIRPRVVRADDPLASVCREWNAAVVETVDGARHIVKGKGAGRWPTAEAVLADLVDLWHARFEARARWQRAG